MSSIGDLDRREFLKRISVASSAASIGDLKAQTLASSKSGARTDVPERLFPRVFIRIRGKTSKHPASPSGWAEWCIPSRTGGQRNAACRCEGLEPDVSISTWMGGSEIAHYSIVFGAGTIAIECTA